MCTLISLEMHVMDFNRKKRKSMELDFKASWFKHLGMEIVKRIDKVITKCVMTTVNSRCLLDWCPAKWKKINKTRNHESSQRFFFVKFTTTFFILLLAKFYHSINLIWKWNTTKTTHMLFHISTSSRCFSIINWCIKYMAGEWWYQGCLWQMAIL